MLSLTRTQCGLCVSGADLQPLRHGRDRTMFLRFEIDAWTIMYAPVKKLIEFTVPFPGKMATGMDF